MIKDGENGLGCQGKRDHNIYGIGSGNVERFFREWPVEEPTAFGIVGSVYVAFGLLSILGLRSPLKFVPVLLMQLCYKVVWFIGVLVPLLVTGHFPSYAISMVIIFVTYIIGDLIAIPFSYIFAKESKQ